MQLHWEYDLRAPREALWRYIADTDWVNRHAGLPKIQDRFVRGSDGSNKHFAWFTIGPLRAEWEERPTLWRAPEYFEVERRYVAGPLRLFVNRTELRELSPERTLVVVDTTIEASSAFAVPLLPVIAARGKAGADRAFSLAERLARGEETRIEDRVQHHFAPLRERDVEPAVVDALDRLINESDDRQLSRIQPYVVADAYGVARKEMLRACLIATKAGLFNLRWDVICPSCRGTPNGYDTLSELRGDGLHCPACDVEYGPQFDRSVEVTFNAKPLGRGVNPPLYCIASPRRSEHVLAQTAVSKHGDADLSVSLSPGVYDINVVGVGQTPFSAEENGFSGEAIATILSRSVEFPAHVGTSKLGIRAHNTLDREVVVRVEEGRWPDTIATAAQVTALQDFRDMFSSEVLAPGLELAIESLAILFTDLVGSTAMYSKAGDAPAFRLVTDHFSRMKAVIDEHDGTIVKTIGDAVMAAFSDPEQCLQAALKLDRAVDDLFHEGEPLRLRVGFHAGPCIAMRANDRIDYFGTTVNLAARLQSLARGGEVTLAQSDDTRLAWAIQRCGRKREMSELPIKGFPAPVGVVRLGPV
jgi:adenylate cyclase